ncbi:ATP-dependent Clp protease ATP-binding subunit [Domibacillus epiphyticus]|uniref:ATP-dependent Clp protease ATP-binding subunit n=1 Tax=Domibacillus epiphyticus TaxID=1714355 RepID=A0A1V2A5B3_9BACI|nr:ATP-dependent Clp protease ATP-binding subunit [Domibacillus epiphyticus]OMP66201.1 ATP-dependent Clp protease ATP-binding subunit [Domibacillus epiphyticus]
MNCQKCKQNEANVQMIVHVNGQSNQYYLCSTCYKTEKEAIGGINMNFQSFGFPFEELMKGMNMPQQNKGMSEPQTPSNSGSGGGLLDEYGRNISGMARAGLIDPVIGRDKEVARVIEILNRRNKNNPVLIGEPGVGKTAIAEGLALYIAEGRVPSKLKSKEVYVLDVASLVSGTGIRGQFEERMKQLIAELKKRKNVLLFIDEIHQLVGAGSAEGSMDAGNILKPALARGELQLIGATTLKEYRQIEKDAALERRFQPVQVAEPNVEETVRILKGLQKHYEDFHSVSYTDDAIEACAALSHRYIQDRFLPDKAIDLLDEAGSKLNLTIDEADIVSIQEQLAFIAKKKESALKREAYEEAAALRDEEAALEKKLENGGHPSDTPVVTVGDIQSLIENKTGIPVGKLQQNEQQKMKNIEKNMAGKVIGQHDAVKKVAKAVRRSRAGLKAKNRPIGSFLFVGPTGVGKTELTKTLAEELFGSKESLIRLDMSEFMEKHSVSKLIGSPPGYVGFEEAGQLTEKVRRNPYSIILLDEIEKAHPDVQHMFLQIMEDGRLTDSQGRTVSFKETVIIMTSNAGAGIKSIAVGFEKGKAESENSILDSLSDYFKPEFLNRFDSIIEFNALEKHDLEKIVELMIDELNKMLREQNVTIEITSEVKEKLAQLGYNPQFGARPLRRVIQDYIEDGIADFILDHPESTELKAVLQKDRIVIVSA